MPDISSSDMGEKALHGGPEQTKNTAIPKNLTSGNMTADNEGNGTSAQPKTSWLCLPAEIRNDIYRMLLIDDESIDVDAWRVYYREPHLLRVNRQICQECRSILYGENAFVTSTAMVLIAFMKRLHRAGKLQYSSDIRFRNWGTLNRAQGLKEQVQAEGFLETIVSVMLRFEDKGLEYVDLKQIDNIEERGSDSQFTRPVQWKKERQTQR